MRGHPFCLTQGLIPCTVDPAGCTQQQPHEKLIWMWGKMDHFEKKAEELFQLGRMHGKRHRSVFNPAENNAGMLIPGRVERRTNTQRFKTFVMER